MYFRLLLSCFLLAVSVPSYAYDFRPTNSEWNIWPGHCKAKYVWTNIGKNSKFARSVSASDTAALKEWELAGVRGLHHFCAGTAYIQRARLQPDPRQRNFELKKALDETQFTIRASNPESVRYPALSIQLATILYEQGELDEALGVLQSTIQSHPDSEAPYSAAAIIHWRRGSLDQAKSILKQGDKVLEGKSAELNYNLGLVLLELGELDEAEKHARLAYELGYPLPGLRVKLRQVGRM